MKAKEYAKLIIEGAKKPDAEFNKVMVAISQDLFGEIVELSKSRHCNCDAAFTAVFDEIDDKYQAICRIVNTKLEVDLLYRDGFREIMFKQADRLGFPQIRMVWKPKKIGG